MRAVRLFGILLLSLFCLILGHMLGILITLPEPDASRPIIPLKEDRAVFEPDYKQCIPKALHARYICERYE